MALLVIIIALGYSAFSAWRRRSNGEGEPTWYVFLFVTSLIAWIAAGSVGSANYNNNMVPFYDVQNLNTYTAVDPAVYRGQQLMDAGRFVFTPDSKLDLQKSMGFRNNDLYCVAPIVSGNTQLDSYDFWAVGTNCCSGHAADFHCGEFNNPQAISGLRLMREDQRPFFRLAVQQAEAAYNMKATHPIFLYWMQDPMAEINAYQDAAFKTFLLSIFGFFAFQFFMVVMAMFVFAKRG
eukprot:CAMPEP_0170602872 /NCGR_PEP_ID=MMETSP0224-20130122/18620_1 /TAXON_ID=285029 /ORGANISM="Togula jolla, Strain CCCM 725" /LENGTH=235 /DNA_ID=CAMNT_0010927735 /DNA_START=269 /DNA_END=976 /DNA_ORIENTATION=-